MEIHYQKATLFKRFIAKFIDLTILVFSTLFFVFIFSLFYKNVSIYKNNMDVINNIYVESKLYVEENNKFIDLLTISEEKYENNEEKYNFLKERLDYFYFELNAYSENDLYKDDYINVLINSGYFENINNSYELKNTSSFNEGYDVLKEIYQNSLKYLSNNKNFVKASSLLFLYQILLILISFIASYIIFELLIPLFIKGNKSIGRLIFSINLVSNTGLNLTNSRFILFSLFNLFFIYILNIFAFLLPSLISIFMIIFTKDNKTFGEYVFNIYVLDAKTKNIIN